MTDQAQNASETLNRLAVEPDLLAERSARRDRPRHIAIIMDGNGRWAQSRDLPRIEGHRRGVNTVRMISETATELGIDAVTLYCLSSENWKRPQAELDFLMHLLEQYLIEERRTIMDQGLRLKVIGRRDRLPENVIEQMDRTLEMSANNPGTQLVLAIDYGGRDEITKVVRDISRDVVAGETRNRPESTKQRSPTGSIPQGFPKLI